VGGRLRRRKSQRQTETETETHIQDDSFIQSLSLGGEHERALIGLAEGEAVVPGGRIQSAQAGLPPLC
jgi:ABC-type phosphate/phosphonate transport system substrate-binding protein